MDPAVFRNPPFLHPSDGPGSLSVQEKLIGSQNYRSCRRSIKIALSTNHKLGFVTGTVVRSADDPVKAEHWDTCNNMVISWIMNSVSDSIVKSIMFIGTASEIWKQLEKRFALSNGSRKYKLHKEVYSCEQQGSAVIDFYTKMKCIWEEIDSMSDLPRIADVTPEIAAFMIAVNLQKEEQHLFQFLNGLDDQYSALRSQLLMLNPLPSVEVACSMLQQEESQREMFTSVESTALYSKSNTKDKCELCGNKGHSPDKCWEKIGYPPWHYKSRLAFKQVNQRTKTVIVNANKRTTTAVTVKGNNVIFTSEQFEQLLKCLPQMTHTDVQGTVAGFDDELDHHFAAGIIIKSSIDSKWILDTGATDHMTPSSDELVESKSLLLKSHIRLPNGNTSVITQIGKVKLGNQMELNDVLVVPLFKFSLLSVPKLTKDKPVVVIFYSKFCVIHDLKTKTVIGLAERHEDLYYLVNVPLH
ncbi:uncharacterized protein [Rutidosis leptorrhynchoides]|uniref:uncharacterized protein n=1 Tax=Rutidosis leptorrhynchoides TaxID=125765 RepID=UPI003A9A0A41